MGCHKRFFSPDVVKSLTTSTPESPLGRLRRTEPSNSDIIWSLIPSFIPSSAFPPRPSLSLLFPLHHHLPLRHGSTPSSCLAIYISVSLYFLLTKSSFPFIHISEGERRKWKRNMRWRRVEGRGKEEKGKEMEGKRMKIGGKEKR